MGASSASLGEGLEGLLEELVDAGDHGARVVDEAGLDEGVVEDLGNGVTGHVGGRVGLADGVDGEDDGVLGVDLDLKGKGERGKKWKRSRTVQT